MNPDQQLRHHVATRDTDPVIQPNEVLSRNRVIQRGQALGRETRHFQRAIQRGEWAMLRNRQHELDGLLDEIAAVFEELGT